MRGAPPGGQQGAPFGASPATQQTPNRGQEAKAMQLLSFVVKHLGDAVAMAGAGSELGQKILKPLQDLSKLVVPGSSSPASDKNTMEEMQMKNAQQNQMMQQLRQQRMQQAQGGGQPGAGAQPPGAGAPGMAA
jgi:hypothetical protein